MVTCRYPVEPKLFVGYRLHFITSLSYTNLPAKRLRVRPMEVAPHIREMFSYRNSAYLFTLQVAQVDRFWGKMARLMRLRVRLCILRNKLSTLIFYGSTSLFQKIDLLNYTFQTNINKTFKLYYIRKKHWQEVEVEQSVRIITFGLRPPQRPIWRFRHFGFWFSHAHNPQW
jgi:hypothetical protein